MSAISIRHIVREFQKNDQTTFRAVDAVSLEIPEGKIFGLLGPNGAGKSTLINMMSGVLLPTAGSVAVFGTDVVRQSLAAKKLLGVVPQEVVVELAFSVEQVLYYFSGMYGVSHADRVIRIPEVLRDLDLYEKRNEKARTLSGGMKRRLMIAKALIHKPRVLILDEPTAGVDVSLRQRLWELVRRLNKEGTTIVFTTHYLEEAEQLCDEIAVIDHGRVVKQGDVRDIQKEFSREVIQFELFSHDVPHLAGVVRVGSAYEYPITNLADDLAAVARHYDKNLREIHTGHTSLEQIFLQLTATKNV
jgi:ABC-2 type transport system ATP-binding protein